jgi:hypothetical protein
VLTIAALGGAGLLVIGSVVGLGLTLSERRRGDDVAASPAPSASSAPPAHRDEPDASLPTLDGGRATPATRTPSEKGAAAPPRASRPRSSPSSPARDGGELEALAGSSDGDPSADADADAVREAAEEAAYEAAHRRRAPQRRWGRIASVAGAFVLGLATAAVLAFLARLRTPGTPAQLARRALPGLAFGAIGLGLVFGGTYAMNATAERARRRRADLGALARHARSMGEPKSRRVVRARDGGASSSPRGAAAPAGPPFAAFVSSLSKPAGREVAPFTTLLGDLRAQKASATPRSASAASLDAGRVPPLDASADAASLADAGGGAKVDGGGAIASPSRHDAGTGAIATSSDAGAPASAAGARDAGSGMASASGVRAAQAVGDAGAGRPPSIDAGLAAAGMNDGGVRAAASATSAIPPSVTARADASVTSATAAVARPNGERAPSTEPVATQPSTSPPPKAPPVASATATSPREAPGAALPTEDEQPAPEAAPREEPWAASAGAYAAGLVLGLGAALLRRRETPAKEDA